MDKRKVIYYEDELNDEFSTAKLTPKRIDGSYVYLRTSLFRRFTHFFWYRVVAMPVAFLYTKLVLHQRIVGAEKMRPFRDGGYFMYGNHTHATGDAFMPNMIEKRKDKYIIVHPNNLSVPVIGHVTPSLGALPLPDDLSAHRNFTAAIRTHIEEGHAVVIYPEAHIWPYYTGIRPFTDVSFAYPVKLGVPSFCFTNTYQKRGCRKHPKVVTYVDGPFFPDPTLSQREARRDLRNRIYETMTERAKLSNAVVITYIKKEKKDT